MTWDIRDEYFRSDKVALACCMCNKCIHVFVSLKCLLVLFHNTSVWVCKKRNSVNTVELHGIPVLKSTLVYHSLRSLFWIFWCDLDLDDNVMLLRILAQTFLTSRSWKCFDSQGMDELITCRRLPNIMYKCQCQMCMPSINVNFMSNLRL